MSNSLYAADFHAWLGEQARALRARDIAHLDLENLAEEIESLGGSQRRELSSRLRVLLMHLLKWQVQDEHRSRSWRSTIWTQRVEIASLLEQSPSLRPTVADVIQKVYPMAKDKAIDEMGLLSAPFPVTCPYVAEDVLDCSFLPDKRAEPG